MQPEPIKENAIAKIIFDVVGCTKKHYASTGETVTVISIKRPAVVVENNKGIRFYTTYDNLKPI